MKKAARPIAEAIAAQRPFKFARHDPRSRTLKRPRRKIMTPEIFAHAEALVLCGWVAWVHSAKGIWHFNETSVSGEIFLSHEFIPSLVKAIAVGRSKALLEKIKEGRYHSEFRIDEAVGSLEKSIGISP